MKSLIIGTLLFSSTAALALTETEQTLTPRAQQFEVRAGGTYEYISADSSTQTMTSNGFIIPGSFFYGINDNNAIGMELGYQSRTAEYNPTVGADFKMKTKGMMRLKFQYKGNFDIGAGTMFLNGSFNVPPEKATLDGATGDRSVSTGQMGISGAIGYIVPVSKINLGGILGYDMNFEGDGTYTSTLNQSFTMKSKGGNAIRLQIFGEIENAFNPNISLNYTSTEEIKYTYNVNSEATYSKTDRLEVRGSLRFIATENVDIIPHAAYATMLNKSDFNADKWNEFLIGGDIRLVF